MDIGNVLRDVATLISDGLRAKGLPVGQEGIQLHNISFVESDSQPGNITMSLVNIEEEKALRYSHTRTVTPAGNPGLPNVYTHNAVVFLNLFVLFSFHRSNESDHFISLNLLGGLVKFLQNQHVFTRDDINLPDANMTSPSFDKLIFELYSLSFEQMNHLWGVLGGKYIPSVMYKVRLFPVKETPQSQESIIKRPRANFHHL